MAIPVLAQGSFLSSIYSVVTRRISVYRQSTITYLVVKKLYWQYNLTWAPFEICYNCLSVPPPFKGTSDADFSGLALNWELLFYIKLQAQATCNYHTIHTLALYVDFSTVELNSQTPSFGSRTLRIWNHSLSDIYLTKKDKRKIKAWSQKTFLGLEVVLCGVSITLKLISRLKLLRLSVISWYPGVWRTVAFFAFLPFFPVYRKWEKE